MSNTYTIGATAMSITQRAFLARLMSNAWALAHQGAQRFGGGANQYFATALRLVWQDSRVKPASVWIKGIGNHFLLPGLQPPVQADDHGLLILPGLTR